MAHVFFQTDGFVQGMPPHGDMFVSMPMLQWTAITVGVSATTSSVGSRPLAELNWRSALMEASLVEDSGRWYKSEAYVQLDASEKSAVSYFLGLVIPNASSLAGSSRT